MSHPREGSSVCLSGVWVATFLLFPGRASYNQLAVQFLFLSGSLCSPLMSLSFCVARVSSPTVELLRRDSGNAVLPENDAAACTSVLAPEEWSHKERVEEDGKQDICSSYCTHMATSVSRSYPTPKPSMQTWSKAVTGTYNSLASTWERRKEWTYLITERASVEDTLDSRCKKSRGLGRPLEGTRHTRDGEQRGHVPRLPHKRGHGWGDTWCAGWGWGARELMKQQRRAPAAGFWKALCSRRSLSSRMRVEVCLWILRCLLIFSVCVSWKAAWSQRARSLRPAPSSSSALLRACWVSPTKVSHGGLKT